MSALSSVSTPTLTCSCAVCARTRARAHVRKRARAIQCARLRACACVPAWARARARATVPTASAYRAVSDRRGRVPQHLRHAATALSRCLCQNSTCVRWFDSEWVWESEDVCAWCL
eukprot:6073134-Pleurochrysis_carterae.AAC.1